VSICVGNHHIDVGMEDLKGMMCLDGLTPRCLVFSYDKCTNIFYRNAMTGKLRGQWLSGRLIFSSGSIIRED